RFTAMPAPRGAAIRSVAVVGDQARAATGNGADESALGLGAAGRIGDEGTRRSAADSADRRAVQRAGGIAIAVVADATGQRQSENREEQDGLAHGELPRFVVIGGEFTENHAESKGNLCCFTSLASSCRATEKGCDPGRDGPDRREGEG